MTDLWPSVRQDGRPVPTHCCRTLTRRLQRLCAQSGRSRSTTQGDIAIAVVRAAEPNSRSWRERVIDAPSDGAHGAVAGSRSGCGCAGAPRRSQSTAQEPKRALSAYANNQARWSLARGYGRWRPSSAHYGCCAPSSTATKAGRSGRLNCSLHLFAGRRA